MPSGRALSRAQWPLWPLLAGVFAPACTQSLWDEPVIYRALDYRIEGPRVLALSVDPPVFTSGAEVAVDALVVGPGLQESRRATLNVCGLDPARPITLLDMECFSDLEQVQTVAAGDLPLAWTPPDLAYDCEVTGASGGCSATVPFILESRLGEAAVVAGFNAEVSASMAGEVDEVPALGPGALGLSVSEDRGGELLLEATLEAVGPEATFRWYVDDGELMDTGRTAGLTDGQGIIRSTNRWRPPAGAGPWRVFVVVGADDSRYL